MLCMHAYYATNAARPQASNGCKHKPSGQSFPRQRALHSAPAVVSNGTAMPQCCEDLHAEINLYACILYWACSTTASQQWVQAQQSGQSFPRQRALQLAPAVVSSGSLNSGTRRCGCSSSKMLQAPRQGLSWNEAHLPQELPLPGLLGAPTTLPVT